MIDKFRDAGITISEEQEKQLSTLMEFMLEYNKKVNLTRITEYDEIIEKHYIDSILPLTMVDVPCGTFCADIGTGAGFPSLPMISAVTVLTRGGEISIPAFSFRRKTATQG